MKEVTYFESHDGKQFGSKEECLTYERRLSIGSDTRFINAIETSIRGIVSADSRGNAVVFGDGDTDEGFSDLAIHIADNLPELWKVYNEVKHARSTPKIAKRARK